MKIGIMGGTFNPIHNAHIIMARYAKEQYNLGRVIFMTSGNPPHKSDVADKNIRHRMTMLAVDNEFEVSDYEIKKTERSYTLYTLQYFKEQYPNDELFFIVGEDSLNDIGKWYKPEEIIKLCSLLVFPRESKKTLRETIKKAGNNIYEIDAPVFGLSSSMIRERIKDGKSVRHMLPDSVIAFIEENELYK